MFWGRPRGYLVCLSHLPDVAIAAVLLCSKQGPVSKAPRCVLRWARALCPRVTRRHRTPSPKFSREMVDSVSKHRYLTHAFSRSSRRRTRTHTCLRVRCQCFWSALLADFQCLSSSNRWPRAPPPPPTHRPAQQMTENHPRPLHPPHVTPAVPETDFLFFFFYPSCCCLSLLLLLLLLLLLHLFASMCKAPSDLFTGM